MNGDAAALVLRYRVFTLLRGEGLLSDERIRLLLSWRHSGFSVYTSVTVPPDDRDSLERLARALMHIPDPHGHVMSAPAPSRRRSATGARRSTLPPVSSARSGSGCHHGRRPGASIGRRRP